MKINRKGILCQTKTGKDQKGKGQKMGEEEGKEEGLINLQAREQVAKKENVNLKNENIF